MADYIEGKPINDRLYLNTNPLFIKMDEPGREDSDREIPSEFSAVMSDLIREANGEDDNFLVKDKELLDAYNKSLDDMTAEQTNQFINESVVAMAERGVPAVKAVEWANEQKKKMMPAKNSGAYTQVKDKRLLAAAEEDPLIKSLLVGGSPEEIETARMLDKMQTGIANYEIVRNKMIEANNDYDEQNILTKVAKGYATGAALPFVENINAARISSKLKEIFGQDFETSGNVNTLYEQVRNRLLNLSSAMTENEFKDLVNKTDEKLLDTVAFTYGDRQNFWSNVYNQNYRINNAVLAGNFAGTALIAAGGIGTAAKIGASPAALKSLSVGALNEAFPGSGIAALSLAKVAKSPIKLLSLKGQRKLAAKLATDDVLETALMDMDTYSEAFNKAGREALESFNSGLSKPFISDAAIDISKTDAIQTAAAATVSPSSMDIGLQKAKELVEEIKNGDLLGRIVKDTKNEAEQKFVIDVVSNLQSQKPYVQSVSSKIDDNIFSTVIELGRGDKNLGFSSMEDAKNFAKNLNITSDDFLNYMPVNNVKRIVPRADGYFIQLERGYKTENGNLLNLGDLVSSKIKSEFAKGLRSEYSGNPVLQKISGNNAIPHYIRTLNNAYQAAEGRTLYLLQGYLKNIKAGSGPVFDTLMDLTRSKKAWIKSDYLLSRGVPEKTVKAYETMRIVEDASRMLDGQTILKDLEELGMRNVKSNGVRVGLGKVAENYNAKNVNLLVGYDEASGKFTTRSVKNSDELKKGVTVYKMQRSIDGSQYIAINNSTLSETMPTWSNTFLSYVPGRKTFSQGSGFIKQVKIARGKDGEKFIEDVATIFSHPNQESVKQITDTMEQARQIAIKVNQKEIDMSQAERLFQALPNRDKLKYESFDSFYGICGKDNLISLDQDATLRYIPDGGKLPDFIDGLSVQDHNRAGISLLDFSNSEHVIEKTMRKDANVLNPFTLSDAPRVSIDEELGLEVKRILNNSTITEYTRLFADDFADTFRDYIGKQDPKMALMDESLLKKVKDKKVRAMMENAQHTFARMKAQPTDFDNWMEGVSTRIADWFAPGWKSPEGSNRLALYKALTKASPTKMLRAYGFHYNLGMWNPRQFYAQAAASINAAEMSPKAAAQITPMLGPILGYMKSGDKSLAARIAKSFGVKQSYLDELVDGAKRLDIWSKGSFGGAYDIAERGSSLWNGMTSTWFYDSGEHMNRLYTGLLAVQEQLNKGVSVAKMSDEALLQVINRQQNLYLNMSRAGSSELQRGLAGVFTQFRGYQMRALELMFDKTMTAAEKSRFLLTTAILGGTKGVVGRKGAAMIHSYLEDNIDIPDYVSQAVYNGALDQYAVENGNNVSVGEFFNVSWGDLVDMAVETNPPSYSAVGKTVGGLATIFNGISRYGRSGESTPSAYISALNVMSDLARKGQLPGGFKNAVLGLWAYHTGERLNNQGMLVDKDLDAIDSAMIALGFRNPMRDIEALAYQKLSDIKEREKDMAKGIQEMFLMAKRAPNQEMSDAYMSAMNTILSDLKEENPLFIKRVLHEAYNPKFLGNFNDDATMRTLRSMLRATGTSYGLDEFEKDLQQANERTKEK